MKNIIVILFCLFICVQPASGETLKLAGGEINITFVDADSSEVLEDYFTTVQDSITAAETALLAQTVFLSDSLTAVHAALVAKTKIISDTSSVILRDAIKLMDSLSVTLRDVKEIENHIHSTEKWLGRSADQTGTDWAKQDTLGVFLAISGNNTWGIDAADTVFVIGTSDTPITAGSVYFDMHKIYVVDASVTSVYKVRFVWSTTTFAAGLAAGNVSETMVKVSSAASRISPTEFQMPRLAVDTKVWAQCWNATDNATLSFYVGIHEYSE